MRVLLSFTASRRQHIRSLPTPLQTPLSSMLRLAAPMEPQHRPEQGEAHQLATQPVRHMAVQIRVKADSTGAHEAGLRRQVLSLLRRRRHARVLHRLVPRPQVRLQGGGRRSAFLRLLEVRGTAHLPSQSQPF